MQVETYECSETAAEPIEACEEAVRIMKELELEGQQALVRPATEGHATERTPYREMTKDEQFVYGVLCPEKTRLQRYRLGSVPLRVLQIAVHAHSLGLFEEFVVWHAASASVPDPVLIAQAPGIDYKWMTRTFILARWGEVLETWPILVKRAVEAKRNRVADVYGTLLRKLQAYAAGDQLTQEELVAKGPDWVPQLII